MHIVKGAWNGAVCRNNPKKVCHVSMLGFEFIDVAHDVDASFGNVKMTLKSVCHLTASIAVLRDCRGLAIRKVACSNPALYLRWQAQYILVTHTMFRNFERKNYMTFVKDRQGNELTEEWLNECQHVKTKYICILHEVYGLCKWFIIIYWQI